jgi:hypothetical protein
MMRRVNLHARTRQLQKRFNGGDCPTCGKPRFEELERGTERTTPEMDAVVFPIVQAIYHRAPKPPAYCKPCRREFAQFDWLWHLRYATDEEIATLSKVMGYAQSAPAE